MPRGMSVRKCAVGSSSTIATCWQPSGRAIGECASFRAGCRPRVPGSTALSRIGCMANGPLLNRLVCSPLRKWKVASVTTLAVKWSTISHNRSLEVALERLDEEDQKDFIKQLIQSH